MDHIIPVRYLCFVSCVFSLRQSKSTILKPNLVVNGFHSHCSYFVQLALALKS